MGALGIGIGCGGDDSAAPATGAADVGSTAIGSEDGPDPDSGNPESTDDTADSAGESVGETASDTSTTADDTAEDSTGVAVGCAASNALVCEDFEGAPLGGFPDGWGVRSSGVWGGNTIGVTDEEAAAGAQSLKIESGTTGAQWMAYMGDISSFADGHWGRMLVRMGTPIPWPQGGVIHGDLVEARGNWNGSNHQVRWAVIENSAMKHNWGYNVQTSNAGEFIYETGYEYDWPADWFCIEWHHDQRAQTATLWVDSVETVTVVPGQDPQLPTFDDISVGWANYQEANPQFTVYLDEVALDVERIGCR